MYLFLIIFRSYFQRRIYLFVIFLRPSHQAKHSMSCLHTHTHTSWNESSVEERCKIWGVERLSSERITVSIRWAHTEVTHGWSRASKRARSLAKTSVTGNPTITTVTHCFRFTKLVKNLRCKFFTKMPLRRLSHGSRDETPESFWRQNKKSGALTNLHKQEDAGEWVTRFDSWTRTLCNLIQDPTQTHLFFCNACDWITYYWWDQNVSTDLL